MHFSLALFFALFMGASVAALKCKFSVVDITKSKGAEDELELNNTIQVTDYQCPEEDKHCVKLNGILTSSGDNSQNEGDQQKNMSFGLQSCESDLARFMEPIAAKIDQPLNYTCGDADSTSSSQSLGPLTYTLSCCSTDECNIVSGQKNDTISMGEDLTEVVGAVLEESSNDEEGAENATVKNWEISQPTIVVGGGGEQEEEKEKEGQQEKDEQKEGQKEKEGQQEKEEQKEGQQEKDGQKEKDEERKEKDDEEEGGVGKMVVVEEAVPTSTQQRLEEEEGKNSPSPPSQFIEEENTTTFSFTESSTENNNNSSSTTESPASGAASSFNTVALLSILSVCLLVGSLLAVY